MLKTIQKHKLLSYSLIIAIPLLLLFVFLTSKGGCIMATEKTPQIISLPKSIDIGSMSYEETLSKRRSVRNFDKKPMTLEQISQILWAAQGITNKRGFRTAPSAGALYPLNVYAIVGEANGISPGIYRYHPANHTVTRIKTGDMRSKFHKAGLGQNAIRTAPVTILFCGIVERTTRKYGDKGVQYVLMEAGHVGQNVLLQAVSLGLGAVPIGAFNENEIRQIMEFDNKTSPLYLIPIGYPSQD
jgi:SagB-type dehydrogenase family enzyme